MAPAVARGGCALALTLACDPQSEVDPNPPSPVEDVARAVVPEAEPPLEVAPESLAARAGLEADDVVFEVDATPIADLDALRAAFGTAASSGAATAKLRVQRDGQPLAVTLSVEPFRK